MCLSIIIMTILITGASGLLGRCLVRCCKESSLPFVGTYHTRKIDNFIKVDFNSEENIKKNLLDNNIKICINCIVQRQVDVCESDWKETKSVNIDMVDNLSRVCNQLNIYLIHISTDYVFDGKIPPFSPDSPANPLQNYGISKLISEKRVINNMKNHTIIRVPVLYSDDIENLSENAVTIIGKKVLNQVENTSEDNYSIRRPVFIPDFCYFILSFVNTPRTGIFHYYNSLDKTTKYKTAQLIGKILNKSTSHIKPITEFSNMASRPYDTELHDDKYDVTLYNKVNLDEGIKRCFSKWIHPVITKSTKDDSIFLMLDLDGTILDTDGLHYEAYKKALKHFNITLEREMFDYLINNSSIDNYIKDLNLNYSEVKKMKFENMLSYTNINFMPGAEDFLKYIIENDINFVIVTNTSDAIIQHYKQCLPILNRIKNWICREDYSNPKPDSECYTLALQKYYKNEKYKLGFENTINGFSSIKNLVDCVYFITTPQFINFTQIKKEDVYLISSFSIL
jgi:S-adenosylmethionine synthetase